MKNKQAVIIYVERRIITKYVLIVGDGMADEKLDELGGKTPLQYAATPYMDGLAKAGTLGMVRTVPPGFAPGSDVANLTVLGYDPRVYYTGRSSLEAMGRGVSLGDGDVSFRCNLVTLSNESAYPKKRLVDYSAGEISTPEAVRLMTSINERLSAEDMEFHTGISYRHLLVWHGGPVDHALTPPHDITDQVVGPYLPQGPGERLRGIMEESSHILAEHPLNKERIRKGLPPASSLWIWGAGVRPDFPHFQQKYGLQASVVAAVDLARGMGAGAGMRVVEVAGATGNLATNFGGKARAALAELAAGCDFVYLHVEAPDEAGHRGELENKIKAIEKIDSLVVREIILGLDNCPGTRIMILPDHPTPVKLRTHTSAPVPFLISPHLNAGQATTGSGFHELSARSTGLVVEEGYTLMNFFIRGTF